MTGGAAEHSFSSVGRSGSARAVSVVLDPGRDVSTRDRGMLIDEALFV